MSLFTLKQLQEMARTFDDVHYKPATKEELNTIVALYTKPSTVKFSLKYLYNIK
jgi:hypothetical protein